MGVWLDAPVRGRLALSGPLSVCPNTQVHMLITFLFSHSYTHTLTHSHTHTLSHTHTHTHTHACTYATVLSLCCLWPPPFSLCHQQHRMDQWILVNRCTRLLQLWYACLKHYTSMSKRKRMQKEDKYTISNNTASLRKHSPPLYHVLYR